MFDQFDLIVSFCALQHCSDQKGALNEISRILKPSGKVLILVPAMNNKAWSQARAKVQNAPKWVSYWQGYTPRKFLNIQQYEDLLKETGFRNVKLENIQTMDPFIDQDEILDWLEGTFAPVVPKDQAREFYREWIEEYLRLDPQSIDENGTIYARLGFIGIEATR
jgi:trans-aconitate methyltransferase